MRFTKYVAVLVMAVAVAVLVPAAHADTFNLTVSNGGIIPTASSYGTVTVLCSTSTSCTIDFKATSGYWFHNDGVGWNVAVLDSGDSISTETAVCTTTTGAGCTFNSGGGNFDGFGSFGQSVSGGTGSSSGNTEILVTITGVDLQTSDFEVSNGDAHFAAAVSPAGSCPAGVGSCTGFAADSGSVNVPEPGTFALLGMGIVGLVGLRRKRVTA
jgi:hypothetical protein